MSGQHTPGPWFVSTASGNTHLYVGGMVVTSPRNAFPNASTPSALAEIDGQTLRINAQIMAAAPDMLDALNLLKAADFGANVKTAEDEKHMDRVAAFARAAIAKAEGGAA